MPESGQTEPLGDLPFIVLARKLEAQKLFEQYPPSTQSQMSMENWQQEADAL